MKSRFNWKSFYLILAICFCLITCGEDEELPPSLDDLHISFLDGWIAADLMPVVLPDPIFCQIELQLRNNNATHSFTNLKILSAEVFFDSTNQLLGKIYFSTDWDGNLEQGELDTVKIIKILQDESPFDPPCGELVYLELNIKNGDEESKTFMVDSLLFGCTY